MKRFPKEVETAIVEVIHDCMIEDLGYIDWPIDEVDFHNFDDLKYVDKLYNDEDEDYSLHCSNPYEHYEALANCATYDKKTNTITFNLAELEEILDIIECADFDSDVEFTEYLNQNHNMKNNININWI